MTAKKRTCQLGGCDNDQKYEHQRQVDFGVWIYARRSGGNYNLCIKQAPYGQLKLLWFAAGADQAVLRLRIPRPCGKPASVQRCTVWSSNYFMGSRSCVKLDGHCNKHLNCDTHWLLHFKACQKIACGYGRLEKGQFEH